MAERKKASGSASSTASRARSEVKEKQAEVEQHEAEEKRGDLLDDPVKHDEPSVARHWIYFLVIVVGSFLLNVAAIVAVAGGQ